MLPGGADLDVPCGPDCALHAPARPVLHQTPERSSSAPRSTAPIEPPPVRHVWVTTDDGRVPGLLKEWDRPAPAWGWLALVVIPVVVADGGWEMTECWVPADAVERG